MANSEKFVGDGVLDVPFYCKGEQMKTKITDIASVIRSKNSGPYEITFDIIFNEYKDFERIRDLECINEELICSLYSLTSDKIVSIIAFAPAKAIKATIKRPLCSGDIGETDVYGAQQHAPLLNLEFEL
jgi:hypothetical protein